MKILVTCPPMLGVIDHYDEFAKTQGIELTCPRVTQTLSEEELIELVPHHDGWIIGDDPASDKVLKAGSEGMLKAAVKWGIGVDNVDFDAANRYGLPIKNTPNMFGNEVADMAMAYVTGLARSMFYVDSEVKKGGWPKPAGQSLADKTVALLGYGDIGRETARRMVAARMNVIVYDPAASKDSLQEGCELASWPDRVGEADYIVLTCSLNDKTHHIINDALLSGTKKGLRVVNVARGKLIDEKALLKYLQNGTVDSVALDVFEEEPLPADSELRSFEKCIFGSHNGSNTIEGVVRASDRAFDLLLGMLRN